MIILILPWEPDSIYLPTCRNLRVHAGVPVVPVKINRLLQNLKKPPLSKESDGFFCQNSRCLPTSDFSSRLSIKVRREKFEYGPVFEFDSMVNSAVLNELFFSYLLTILIRLPGRSRVVKIMDGIIFPLIKEKSNYREVIIC